jgi:hypothetical protein
MVPTLASPYTLLHFAIITFLDYRLMPESTGLEIMPDISGLWTWAYQIYKHILGTVLKWISTRF